MEERWARLLPLFEGQDKFILRSRPNTAYAWIECANMTNTQCRRTFLSVGIDGLNGEEFGIFDK